MCMFKEGSKGFGSYTAKPVSRMFLIFESKKKIEETVCTDSISVISSGLPTEKYHVKSAK